MQEVGKTQNPNIKALVCGVWQNRQIRINHTLESRFSAAFVGVRNTKSQKGIVVGYLYCDLDGCNHDSVPRVVFCCPEEFSKDRTLTTEEFLRFVKLLGMQDCFSPARLRACLYLVRHDNNDWHFPPKSLRPDVARAKEVARSREGWMEMDTVDRLPVYPSQIISMERMFRWSGVDPAKPSPDEKQMRN